MLFPIHIKEIIKLIELNIYKYWSFLFQTMEQDNLEQPILASKKSDSLSKINPTFLKALIFDRDELPPLVY